MGLAPIFCIECGYDLSHTDEDGRCPECGLDVATSLASPLRDPRWRRWLVRGIGLLVVALGLQLLLTLPYLLYVSGAGPWLPRIYGFLWLARTALAATGWWMIASRSTASSMAVTAPRLRRAVRIAVLCMIGAELLERVLFMLVIGPIGGPLAFTLTSAALSVPGTVMTYLGLLFLGVIARAVLDRPRMETIVRWLIACLLMISIVGIAANVVLTLAVSNLGGALMPGWIETTGMVYWAIWSSGALAMFFWVWTLRSHLKRATRSSDF